MLELFNQINTPDELMYFMNKYIRYGWLDKDKSEHVETLKGFRENYIVSTLNETLEHGLGTCIEQAKMIKTFFDSKGYEIRMFCIRRYEDGVVNDDVVRMHCFVLYMDGDVCYHFEHSNAERRGIHEYSSYDEAIKDINDVYAKRGDIRVISELPDIIPGLSFLEFNKYINELGSIDLSDKKRLI